MAYIETPTESWIPMKNKQKKALIKFILGGLAALALSQVESFINEKADERYPDEETDQEDN